MQVTNRHLQKEPVSFDKISNRIADLCNGLDHVDPFLIAKDTISAMYDGISTVELDVLSADIASTKILQNPDYGKLAGRILSSNLDKSTSDDYFTVVCSLYDNNIISKQFYDFCYDNQEAIQKMIDYTRDYLFDYFGIKTLMRSYLLKINEKIVERPQHMWMRVAIQIHGCHKNGFTILVEERLQKIKETYDYLSQLYFTHATPTLFNSGMSKPQLSSCYLMGTSDSIEDIFKTVSDCAKISKWSGGLGLSLSNIRAKGSRIRGTNGKSDGIIPLCRVLQETTCYINQGGKRNGSLAVYLETWHADIFNFVELRKNTGDEKLRCRDLFLGLWICDLFMKRVEADEKWSLMCPDECPGLVENYGEAFEKLYLQYEMEGRYKKKVRAQELWSHIIENQIETGMPYIAYKDSVNSKNMQAQLGTIKNSNLCIEISLYSDKDNYAVCNLSSICLPKFVENGVFNFEKLQHVAGVITQNLNHVIDVNFYPTPECKRTNVNNRPIGIGVQGLADVYFMLKLPFGSKEARQLNKLIFENIYYGAVKKSIDLAKRFGRYESMDFIHKNGVTTSPHSQGLLQFHLWEQNGTKLNLTLDWEPLLKELKEHGIANSLLTAVMPTASTSQICGNLECIEPITSNIYNRKTLSGEFTIVNPHLVKDLMKLGLWSKEMSDEIIHDNGSVQMIRRIPKEIKEIYKTAYEVKLSDILNQAIERSPFVDHQQSTNLFMKTPNTNALNTALFYGWKNGLKTGMYYLRTQPASDANKFGLDSHFVQKIKQERQEIKDEVNAKYKDTQVCPRDEYLRNFCDSCSA